MTRSELRNLGKGLAFLSPWLVGFLVFTMVPVVLSLYYSFCDYSLLQKPVFIGADNYATLLWQPNEVGGHGDPIFKKALWNTFKYAAIVIPGGLCVSLGLALLLNVRVRGQAYYRTIIFLPTLVPTIASAMLWMWLFNKKLGLVNLLFGPLFSQLGWEAPGWLVDPKWALPALAFMSLWGVGHTVVIYLAGLQDVPKELHEAAEIDGAGPLARMWHVTLPLLSPVIFFNVVMAIIGTFQVFDAPMLMTQGGPDRATTFITLYLYDNAFTYLKMGYASAIAWLLLVIVLVLTGIAFGVSKKWVHYYGE